MQFHRLLVVAFAGLLLAGGVTAVGPPQDDLELTAGNTTTTAGNTAEITVTVTNNGTKRLGGNYTVAVNQSTLSPDWTANTTNATIVRGPLEPNETRNATVYVSVPENTSVVEDTIRLNISSGEKQWANATAVVTVKERESSTPDENEGWEDDSSDAEDDDSDGAIPGVVAGGGGMFPAERGVYVALWGLTLTKIEVVGFAILLFAALALFAYERS